MIPVVTPEEMAAVDAAAPEPVEVLISRAGAAVARAALGVLGGAYGRRVIVVAGRGNNGADGHDAARRLARRGVAVTVVAAADAPPHLPASDLVIDAAYGTGFHGSYRAPEPPPGTAVLAVDIPSGVDGRTGELAERVLRADRTVTFAALKPGLVLEPGATWAGEVEVADIGLDVSRARCHLVEAVDVAGWLPEPSPTTHKWRSSAWVVAGSPGMAGAASLTTGGAQRAGAGYVRLSTPGLDPADVGVGAGIEVVRTSLPRQGWAAQALSELGRFRALAVGNGLGLEPGTVAEVRRLLAGTARGGGDGGPVPTVVDADGLTALGEEAAAYVGPHVVLTPHDGEYARLAGAPPDPDRIAAARSLAARTGAVVLLKGRATVVAEPGGRALVSRTGDARLATAGTGDVLAGVIAALLAQGLPPFEAAGAAAFLHGRAAALGWRRGFVAGDLLEGLPRVLDGTVEG